MNVLETLISVVAFRTGTSPARVKLLGALGGLLVDVLAAVLVGRQPGVGERVGPDRHATVVPVLLAWQVL